MKTLWLGNKVNEAEMICSISEFASCDCFVTRCSVLPLSYIENYTLYPTICINGGHWQPYSDLNSCDLCDKQGVSFLSHYLVQRTALISDPLTRRVITLPSRAITSRSLFFIALWRALWGRLIYTMKSFTSSLLLSAYFGLDYGPIKFRGGRTQLYHLARRCLKYSGIGYSWLP